MGSFSRQVRPGLTLKDLSLATAKSTFFLEELGPAGLGNDDSAVFQQAATAIATPGNRYYQCAIELRAGATYKLATHVTFPGWVGIIGNGAKISRHASNPVAPISGTPVTPDTSYPDANNVGPMAGCAFYFTSANGVPYYTLIKDLLIDSFRFGFCYLNPHNTPIFDNVMWQYCNAGVFCYKGCQNYTYVSCGTRGNPMGPMHLSSATCFPTGHPDVNNTNYYTDGLRFLGHSMSVQGGIENVNFDNWFRDSILRPTTQSWTTGANALNQGYVYPFADTDICCKPSVWTQAYIPFRNPRVCFGFYTENMDYRMAANNKGIALINTAVNEFHCNKFWCEGTLDVAASYYTVGSLISGTVSGYNTNISGQPQLPFFSFTGQGVSAGGLADTSNCVFLDMVPSLADPTFYPGITQGVVSYISEKQYSTINEFTGADGRNDAPLTAAISVKSRRTVDNQGAVLRGWNATFSLPAKGANTQNAGVEWKRSIRLDYDGAYFSGIAGISAINGQTLEEDYCEYELQQGPTTGDLNYTLATGATINNGDLTITYNSANLADFTPYSRWQIGSTGVYVVVLSANKTTKVLTLASPVSGLSATHTSDGAAATGLTRPNFCRMLTGWVKTGTITTTNGSAAVTGTGTKFLRDIKEGQHLYDRLTCKYIGQVLSITSDTALTLTANTALVVTAQVCCARNTDWFLFGFGVSQNYASAASLYLANRKASSNGFSAPTDTLTPASISLVLRCNLKSFLSGEQ